MTRLDRPAGWWEEPRYVEAGGELVFRQPFVSEGVRMFSLVLEVKEAILNRYLDRMFNRPLGGRFDYRAKVGSVVLNFFTIRRESASPPDELGAIQQKEVAFWILAEDKNRKGADPEWSVPYMFVTGGAALITGREIYGFPKQPALIDITQEEGYSPTALNLRGPSLKTFGPDSFVYDYEQILAVEFEGPPEPLESLWRSGHDPDATDIARALTKVGLKGRPDPALFSALGENLLRRKVPMVLLKQFRSVVDPEKACYQAVIQVDLELSNIRGLGLLPDGYCVTIESLANDPFQRELGLNLKSVAQVGFWLDFDFKIGSATKEAKVDVR